MNNQVDQASHVPSAETKPTCDLSAWQPIETAPKTDEDVLLCFADGDVELGYWRDDAQTWDSGDGWFRATPTHWMPLPTAPITQANDDRKITTVPDQGSCPPLPESAAACTECPYVFTPAELAAEDQEVWGHPCHGVKGETDTYCESFRTPVESDSSTVAKREHLLALVETARRAFTDFDILITRGDLTDEPRAYQTRDALRAALEPYQKQPCRSCDLTKLHGTSCLIAEAYTPVLDSERVSVTSEAGKENDHGS